MRSHPLAPFLVACAGIALYAVMDALMKRLVIGMGVHSALFWRMAIGAVLSAGIYAASRPRRPSARALRIHAARSMVGCVMALAFFWGIARVPLAEAIGLSFIAPLIALALAAVVLGERVGRASIAGAVLGLAGVAVVLAGQSSTQARAPDAAWGVVAVLVSAVFYAINLILARLQAQHAAPREIAFFQSLFITGLLGLGAPWFGSVPPAAHWPAVLGAALLGTASLMLLGWAYARAEAQRLVTSEYTAFVWAAIMGWLWFDEVVTGATLAGTALIVVGCWIAARAGRSGGGPATPEPNVAAP